METALYKIKTTNFEGPLEVLLGLIEKRKLFINEISLATITDDYINYVRSLNAHDVGDYTSFITIAATLILIKSRSLIPNLELTTEEESDVASLEHRLEMYKLIREIGVEIEAQFGKNIIFPRLETDLEMKVFAPHETINQSSLLGAMNDVIRAIPEPVVVKPEVIVLKVRSLEETINDLVERVQKSLKMSFKEFSSNSDYKTGKERKVGTIVSFLAMLELVRQGFMEAFQGEHFSDISIEKIELKQENTNGSTQ